MATLLLWLVKSYDQTVQLSITSLQTEQERIAFLKSVGTFMVQKARIKLHLKKLYMADKAAIPELLKIVNLLHESHQDTTSISAVFSMSDVPMHVSNLRQTRQLFSETTLKGGALYDLLARETTLSVKRAIAIATQLDPSSLGKNIKLQIAGVKQNTLELQDRSAAMKADVAGLNQKIQKRNIELERREKRLKSLQGVRPAFMDEYERLEEQLKVLYLSYAEKLRNLAYLEHSVAKQSMDRDAKLQAHQASMKKMQLKLAQEETHLMVTGSMVGRDDDDDDEDEKPQIPNVKKKQPTPTTSSGLYDF